MSEAPPSADQNPHAPIKIVGSRLRALSLVAIGLAVLVAQASELLPWALPLALLCLLLALVVGIRRATLSGDGVEMRRITGTRWVPLGELEAYADHRHLLLRFTDGGRARIEVPVEIRPQVRDWAEAVGEAADKGPGTAATDPNTDPNQGQ